jgi:hypothetical protein
MHIALGLRVKSCANFVRARIYLSEKTKATTLKKVISEKYHCIIATLASSKGQ